MNKLPSYWKKKGSSLCRRVNATLFAEYFSPRFFLITAITAICLYAFRRLDINLLWAVSACVAGLLVLFFFSYKKKKGDFFNERDAFAFMDYHFGLQAALSTASEGKSIWPNERRTPSGLRWKSPSFFFWLPSGGALIAAAMLLPLPREIESNRIWDKPPSIATMENWVETLEQIKELHKEDVEQISEKLEELTDRSPEEMYSHSALEAAESLQDHMKMDLHNFAQNMEQLQNALSEMKAESNDSQSAQWDQQALNKAMEALDSMKEQGMQLSEGCCNNPGDKEGDQKGDNGGEKSGSKPLTSDQIGSLSKDQLQNLQDSLGDIASEMQKLEITELESLLQSCQGGEGDGDGEGEEGKMPGKGAANRGKADAPLTLGDEAPELDLNKESIERDPNAKVLLGEKVGEEIGQHEAADPSGSSPGSSGAAGNSSSGGQAVWSDQYTPKEREALKNFFK